MIPSYLHVAELMEAAQNENKTRIQLILDIIVPFPMSLLEHRHSASASQTESSDTPLSCTER